MDKLSFTLVSSSSSLWTIIIDSYKYSRWAALNTNLYLGQRIDVKSRIHPADPGSHVI